ncbi:MAG: hypothetical protein ISS45_12825 [Candidatus Omnitrophica bacterium]|nr:hypothetical protein [Candidatus Omnitrophota bacterium]
MTKEPEATQEEFIEIEKDCRFIKVRPEVLQLISVGDKELGWDGEVMGEIVSLGESKPYKYEFDIGTGQKIVKEAMILRQVGAKLKLKTAVQNGSLYYKGKMIKIGSTFEFKTGKYAIVAILLKEEEEEEEIQTRIIDLYVTLKDLDEDTLKKISVGNKEVDEKGETIAEILSLGKIEDNSLEFNLGSGNFVMGQDSNKRQISTKMRLKCQVKDSNQLYFKGEKAESNTFLEFKTDKYKAIGLVAKTFEITPLIKEKWISLRVKFSGVLPEVATTIQKGDIEKDALEKTVARISTVISNNPSQVLTLKDDEFITLSHPFQRDILSSLDVLCIEKEGVYYFKNYPVKMGNNITFTTDLYSISGLIVGMEMK